MESLRQQPLLETDAADSQFLASIAEDRPRADDSESRQIVTLREPYDAHRLRGKWDEYEVIRRLAAGGQGVVFEARRSKSKSKSESLVAVKVLDPFDYLEEESRSALIDEVKNYWRINNDNIVRISDVGDYEGFPFLVMEMVDGQPLLPRSAVREKGARPRSVASPPDNSSHKGDVCHAGDDSRCLQPRTRYEVAELFLQVAHGLAALHEVDTVHLDLKPSNILISKHPTGPMKTRPKITDFGIASRLVGEPGGNGKAIVLGGTRGYKSPEQITEPEVDKRSDIFSLGIVMYEALVGKHPFKAKNDADGRNVDQRTLEDKPPTPHTVGARLWPGLEEIVLKCLEKEQDDRYQSAAELRDDLQDWMNATPIRSLPVSRVDRALLWTRRNRWWVTIVFCCLAVVAVVGLWAIHVGMKNVVIAEKSAAVERKNEELEELTFDLRVALASTIRSVAQLSNQPGAQGFARDSLGHVVAIYERSLERSIKYPELEAEAADSRFRLAFVHDGARRKG